MSGFKKDSGEGGVDVTQSNIAGRIMHKGTNSTPTSGDWKAYVDSSGVLRSVRFESGEWVEYEALGSSSVLTDIGMDTPGRKIFFEDNTGKRYTMMYPAHTDQKGVAVGNYEGVMALASSGRFIASYPVGGDSARLAPIDDGTDPIVLTTFGPFSATFTDNRILTKVYFHASSPAAGSLCQIKFSDTFGNVLYESCSDFDFSQGGGTAVVDGENPIELAEPFPVPLGMTVNTTVEFSEEVTLLGSGSNPLHGVWAKTGHVQEVLHLPTWSERKLRQDGVFAEDNWIVEAGVIQVCNTAGAQTGTFADNTALWDILGSGGGSGAGLVQITEGGHTGYRRSDVDPAKCGDIGEGAIDLAFNENFSSTRGATGSRAYAEGRASTASGSDSHAEGLCTVASAKCAHAEGSETDAEGEYSHAEGYYTRASGFCSHAQGRAAVASGQYSHAGGRSVAAGYDYQTAVGTYNLNKSTSLLEVGNGVYGALSNAIEVDKDGNINITGKYKINGYDLPRNKRYVGAAPSLGGTSFYCDSFGLTQAQIEAVDVFVTATDGYNIPPFFGDPAGDCYYTMSVRDIGVIRLTCGANATKIAVQNVKIKVTYR
ncbi:MAG: hypothetical protein GY847_00250 [Proteobacteria bacterium]|nr:hypothetical protein [Pseudomonadota bacterium]